MAKTKNKSVRVTIELPSRFVGMLHNTLSLKGVTKWLAGEDGVKRLTAEDLVAMLILAEAKGATKEQIAMAVPHEWREAGLEPTLIHEERRVYEDGKLIGGGK